MSKLYAIDLSLGLDDVADMAHRRTAGRPEIEDLGPGLNRDH